MARPPRRWNAGPAGAMMWRWTRFALCWRLSHCLDLPPRPRGHAVSVSTRYCLRSVLSPSLWKTPRSSSFASSATLLSSSAGGPQLIRKGGEGDRLCISRPLSASLAWTGARNWCPSTLASPAVFRSGLAFLRPLTIPTPISLGGGWSDPAGPGPSTREAKMGPREVKFSTGTTEPAQRA
jgi:hypothetical protein